MEIGMAKRMSFHPSMTPAIFFPLPLAAGAIVSLKVEEVGKQSVFAAIIVQILLKEES